MSIIEKYKKEKENKVPINLVINSLIDYKNHDLNILKECLNKWSDESSFNCHSTFNYSWIYTNLDTKEKLFFIKTSKGELIAHNLNNIINNEKIMANSYMTGLQENILYYE